MDAAALALEQQRDAEVGQRDRPTVGVDEDVGRLDVAVHDALLVHLGEDAGELDREGREAIEGERAVAEQLAEIDAAVGLEHEHEVGTRALERERSDHAGLLEPSDQRELVLDACDGERVGDHEHLGDDREVVALAHALPHLRGGRAPQLSLQPIAIDVHPGTLSPKGDAPVDELGVIEPPARSSRMYAASAGYPDAGSLAMFAPSPTRAMSTAPSRPYVDLADQAQLDELTSAAGGAAVIDFWSPTCGPCLAMARDFEHVAGQFERDEVRFFKVDTSTHGHLAAPFNITSVPTILFLLDGEVVDAVIGKMDARRLGERAEWLLTKKQRRAKGGLIGRLFG